MYVQKLTGASFTTGDLCVSTALILLSEPACLPLSVRVNLRIFRHEARRSKQTPFIGNAFEKALTAARKARNFGAKTPWCMLHALQVFRVLAINADSMILLSTHSNHHLSQDFLLQNATNNQTPSPSKPNPSPP
jgi:hypothetical protein